MKPDKIADRTDERNLLVEQISQVAKALGETFAPFCEVVVHDLLKPRHAIISIHNNLSGRSVGDPTTEIGLARIADSQFPQTLINYSNRFADGRQAKSTSIGIRDSSGCYVAALCINIDLTMVHGLQSVMAEFGRTDAVAGARESLDSNGAEGIRAKIDEFAARLAKTPRALKTAERRALIVELKNAGFMDIRRAMDITSQHLGVSRATVYNDAK